MKRIFNLACPRRPVSSVVALGLTAFGLTGCASAPAPAPKEEVGMVAQAATIDRETIELGDVPIWRLTLCLTTGEANELNGEPANPGTDNRVYVVFNESESRRDQTSMEPVGFRLDEGGDDFQGGEYQCYDIPVRETLGNVFVRDLRSVTVGKQGEDAWCLAAHEVIVNSRFQMFRGNFDHQGGCRWINDTDVPRGGYEVALPNTNMVAEPEHLAEAMAILQGRQPLRISMSELEDRIETREGGALQDSGEADGAFHFRWKPHVDNHEWVTVRRNGDRLEVRKIIEWDGVGDGEYEAVNRGWWVIDGDGICERFLPTPFCDHSESTLTADGTYEFTLRREHE